MTEPWHAYSIVVERRNTRPMYMLVSRHSEEAMAREVFKTLMWHLIDKCYDHITLDKTTYDGCWYYGKAAVLNREVLDVRSRSGTIYKQG